MHQHNFIMFLSNQSKIIRAFSKTILEFLENFGEIWINLIIVSLKNNEVCRYGKLPKLECFFCLFLLILTGISLTALAFLGFTFLS